MLMSPLTSPDKGATEAPSSPPSTHLQLLQFPEPTEDLRDGVQTEVKSRKLILDIYSDHFLRSPFFDRTPKSIDIDC